MHIIKLKDESNGILALSGTGGWNRSIKPINESEVFYTSRGAKNSLHQVFKYAFHRYSQLSDYKKEDFEIREVTLTLK